MLLLACYAHCAALDIIIIIIIVIIIIVIIINIPNFSFYEKVFRKKFDLTFSYCCLPIIKHQVNYLRSLVLKDAFVGESAEIDKSIIEETAETDLLYGSSEAEHHKCRDRTRNPCKVFFMVRIACGMDRGRVPPTATTTSGNVAAILQLIPSLGLQQRLILRL